MNDEDKITNEAIKTWYEEGGYPELHVNRPTDTGMPTYQVVIVALVLVGVVAALVYLGVRLP